jgi:hypothetical protein
MRYTLLLSALPLAVASTCLSSAYADTQADVRATMAQMKVLSDMDPRKNYSLRVDGKVETGRKEMFLRRRTPSEILRSGLSSGCGDYAAVFSELMSKRGYETLIVDGAAVSAASLTTCFMGHCVVAVRRRVESTWWLVNSTGGAIISENWSRGSTYFRAFGGLYWIGYVGPLSRYPVHGQEGLKAFYRSTLSQVPRDFLRTHLVRLKYVVDASLKDKKGGYLNPNLRSFLGMQEAILKAEHIDPVKTATVHLTKGGNKDESGCSRDGAGRVTVTLGLDSGCSVNLLGYIEMKAQ